MPHKVRPNINVKTKSNDAVLARLSQKLSIQKLDDWYNVTSRELVKAGEGGVYTTKSLLVLLKQVHPDYNWVPWRFNRVPPQYWENNENKLKFLEWVFQELRLNNLDDWYSVRCDTIRNFGGSTLLRMYDNSSFQLLSSLYPEHEWLPWKFDKVPIRFWNEQANQKMFFDWLGAKLNITHPNQWYEVKTSDVISHFGSGLLWGKYNGSLFKALSTVYPEHKWLWWKFEKSPSGLWKDLTHQKTYLDWLTKELSIQNLDDWYKVTKQDLVSCGATSFLKKQYNGSLYHALKSLYPEHNWMPWKFRSTPRYVFDNEEGIRQWISYAGSLLGINCLDDWYRVSVNQIMDIGGGPLLTKYNGLFSLLCNMYPDYDWNPMKLQSHQKKSSQRFLHLVLSKLFPQYEIFEDYFVPTVHETPQNFEEPRSLSLQLDIWIPSLRLGFEYQGRQHFQDVFFFGIHKQYTRRDDMKRKRCEELGLTLIEVPYWWDKSAKTIIEMITQVRPDILSGATELKYNTTIRASV